MEQYLQRSGEALLRELFLRDFEFAVKFIIAPHLRFARFHFDKWIRRMRQCGNPACPHCGWWKAIPAWHCPYARRNLLQAYPGSAKTTVCHEFSHAHMLLLNWWQWQNQAAGQNFKTPVTKLTTLSGSQNLEKAEVITASIKNLFMLPMVMGIFCDQPLFNNRTSFEEIVYSDSANSRFDLVGMQVAGEKDFSVQAFGMDGGQVISKHARLITLDDVVTFENSRTPAELKRIEEKYFVDVDRAANPDAQLNLLGYRHHPADLYKKLSRLEDFQERVFDDVPFQMPNGKSSWPERYPDEYVAKKLRSLPPILAAAMYQQNDKLMSGDIVKYEWLRFYRNKERTKLLPVVIGVDLATSQKESADYCAFCVLAYDSETKEFFEEEMIYGRFTFDERLKMVAKLALRYHGRLQKIGIEKPASGSDIVAILKRETRLRVEAIQLPKDKVSRLIMNQHIFQQGRIYLWGPEDRPDFESLKRFRGDDMEEVGTFIEELLAWKADQQPPPPVHDDRTDAFVICLHLFGTETAGDALKALEQELENRNKALAEAA